MKQFVRNLPLGSQIALLISTLVSVSLLILTFVTIQLERNYYRQELENQAGILLETLPFTIRDQLYFVELDELLDVAGKVGENPNINKFVIYDPRGIILADSDVKAPVFSQDVDPFGEILTNLDYEDSYIVWEEDQFISGRPIFIGNQRLGAVSVSMSTVALDEKIRVLITQSIVLSIIIMLIGLGLSFVLGRQITNPLRILTKVAREMADGNTSIRVDVHASGEIGQLGEAFNYMTEAIQLRETKLRDLTLSLEHTVEERTEELRLRNAELEQLAISDPLTKISNRRHFFELAEKEYKRAERYQHPLSLVLADVDHFKKINDTYGHMIGDQTLTKLARFLEKNIRNVDVVARYGGEEFIILMPEISCEDARITSERLCQSIADTPLIDCNSNIMLTISFGVACWDGKEEVSFETLLSRADQAMYKSKEKGRNSVTVW